MIRVLIFCSSILMSTAYGQENTLNKFEVDFEFEKRAALQTLGCLKNKDEACKKIETSKSAYTFWQAIGEKKESDQKQLKDRLNVLECCLGVDRQNSCEGLSAANQKDLKECKKTLADLKPDK